MMNESKVNDIRVIAFSFCCKDEYFWCIRFYIIKLNNNLCKPLVWALNKQIVVLYTAVSCYVFGHGTPAITSSSIIG